MAWALANSANVAVSASSDSRAFNSTGGNMLIVAIGIKENGGAVGTITITYNGVSMTEYVTVTNSVTTTRSSIFYLASPASGSNTLAVTCSASTDEIHYASESYTGINLATSPRASITGTATDSTPTVTVSSASTDLVVDLMAQTARLITSAGGSQTVFFSGNTIGASRATAAGATTAMSWTLTGGTAAWGQVAASFIERIDTVVTPPVLAMTTTKYAPSIIAGQAITPPVLSMAVTGYAPSILLSDNYLITPGVLGLLMTLYPPIVTQTTDPLALKSYKVTRLPNYNSITPLPVYTAITRLD